MFAFGAYKADMERGIVAVLDQWVTLPGLSLESVERAGDGRFHAGGSLDSANFTFRIRLEAPTPAAVLALADELSATCHPSRGLQTLRIDVAPGWAWGAAVSGEIPWTRGAWDPGAKCQLHGRATFTCPDPYAYADPDETWLRTSAGALDVRRTRGNAPSYPTLELRGALTASQSVTLDIAGVQLVITGPLDAAEVLRLDYQTMDFGRWQGPTKVASVVPQMSTYTRPELPMGASSVAASTTGQLTQVRVAANSRRA